MSKADRVTLWTLIHTSEALNDLPLADLRRVGAAALAELERVGSDFSRMEAEVADLKVELAVKDAKIQEQAEEIAWLKGLSPRPRFKGKEAATSKPLGARKTGRKLGRGSIRDKLAMTAEIKLKALDVPPGSRFKGYEDVTVQDLRIQVAVTRYRRERWETPDGERIVADLPMGIVGAWRSPSSPRSKRRNDRPEDRPEYRPKDRPNWYGEAFGSFYRLTLFAYPKI